MALEVRGGDISKIENLGDYYIPYLWLSKPTLIQLSELGCPWQYFVALWVNFQSLVALGNISLPLSQLSELGYLEDTRFLIFC